MFVTPAELDLSLGNRDNSLRLAMPRHRDWYRVRPQRGRQVRGAPWPGGAAGGWTNDFLDGDRLAEGNPIIAAAPGIKDATRHVAGLS